MIHISCYFIDTAPSRSPRKKKRRSSVQHHTPAQRANTPLQSEGFGGHHTPARRVNTPMRSGGAHVPAQNSAPAQRGSAVKVRDTHPPSRLSTPKTSRHTPGTPARRINSECNANSFHPIQLLYLLLFLHLTLHL